VGDQRKSVNFNQYSLGTPERTPKLNTRGRNNFIENYNFENRSEAIINSSGLRKD
jgi:hypothetical protein